jgi:hypothetical protein
MMTPLSPKLIASIIDGTSAALPYADIPHFLYNFVKLGKPLGIKLTIGSSPSPFISPQYQMYN